MFLMLLWRYFHLISEYTPNFYQKVYYLIEGILGDQRVNEVPRLIACDLLAKHRLVPVTCLLGVLRLMIICDLLGG